MEPHEAVVLCRALLIEANIKYGLAFLLMVPGLEKFMIAMKGNPEWVTIPTVDFFWICCDLAYQELKF